MSLFLILAAVCFASVRSSGGLRADIAVPDERGLCGDGERFIILRVGTDGTVRLNGGDVKLTDLARRLHKVFSIRTGTVVSVSADVGSTFGQIAAAIDVASLEVDHVALLSQTVARKARSGLTLPVFDSTKACDSGR